MNFHLESEWHLSAPPDAVWAVLTEPESWPGWWPQIARVERVVAGAANDEGAVRRTWWTTRLGYGFVIDFTTQVAEKPYLIVLAANGDLRGIGRWELSPIPIGTRVRYVWQVVPARRWMRWSAALLAPLFAWNHHAVMRRGAAGMARRLDAELMDYRAVKRT